MYSNYARLRDERGLTDYKVAQNTGIATATLTAWKQGKYVPKYDKLSKIAAFLGVSLDELVNGSGSGTDED